jgi:hypothetical protein
MDRRGASSMGAGQDVWDWEVLPDHMSPSSMCQDSTNLAGKIKNHQFFIYPHNFDRGRRINSI